VEKFGKIPENSEKFRKKFRKIGNNYFNLI